MKTIRLQEYGDSNQLRLEEIDPPVPGPDEVLIRIAGAAVNPVDTKIRRGFLKSWLPLTLPVTLGADFSGTIVSVGPNVNTSRLGERVMGMVSVQQLGAYAEQMVVPAHEAVRVPDAIDLVDASALPMGGMTGYDLTEKGIAPQRGEKVIVTGAGGSVGRAAVFAAAERGAEVIALVRSQPETAISGATSTVMVGDEAALRAAGPFDCVADTVGGEVAQSLFAHLRPGGRFATAVTPVPTPPEGRGITVQHVIVQSDAGTLTRFAEAIASGRAVLPPTRRYPLEKAAEVHELILKGGTGGKLILVP